MFNVGVLTADRRGSTTNPAFLRGGSGPGWAGFCGPRLRFIHSCRRIFHCLILVSSRLLTPFAFSTALFFHFRIKALHRFAVKKIAVEEDLMCLLRSGNETSGANQDHSVHCAGAGGWCWSGVRGKYCWLAGGWMLVLVAGVGVV